jgi:CRP-like cAMP-binding protein
VDAISIPSHTFTLMIKNSPDFRAYLSEAMARAIAESALMINLLANARAEVRVIFYLLKIFSAMSNGKLHPGFIEMGLSRTEIGDFLGLNRETVSRKLTTLAACGLIRVAGHRVELRDPEALKRICGPIVLRR